MYCRFQRKEEIRGRRDSLVVIEKGERPAPKNRIWNPVWITNSGDIYSRIREEPLHTPSGRLSAAKHDESDLGRYAEAYWGADGAQTTIHVDMRHGRRW